MNALARAAEHQEWLEERLAAIEPGEVARQAVLAREVATKVRMVAQFMSERLGKKSPTARSFRRAEVAAFRAAKHYDELLAHLAAGVEAATEEVEARGDDPL